MVQSLRSAPGGTRTENIPSNQPGTWTSRSRAGCIEMTTRRTVLGLLVGGSSLCIGKWSAADFPSPNGASCCRHDYDDKPSSGCLLFGNSATDFARQINFKAILPNKPLTEGFYRTV